MHRVAWEVIFIPTPSLPEAIAVPTKKPFLPHASSLLVQSVHRFMHQEDLMLVRHASLPLGVLQGHFSRTWLQFKAAAEPSSSQKVALVTVHVA